MLLLKITLILCFYVSLEANGSPLPEEKAIRSRSDTLTTQEVGLLLSSRLKTLSPRAFNRDYYLCGNYGKPYDPYAYLNSLFVTDDVLEFSTLRQRCRYSEESPQKYTTWDLAR